ncbi:peptidoglycan recognition family protein [Geobacter sp. SVR]|uniref:peptidoglycan recognition protein family protein n=1 Tax=Geobacter sp. SVR TaxID=2495594 RepID=UPI00143F055C|nr:peptidoglycan recognition family protein [Geobacter sp. SVR]BCS53302.1 N-acetylmuramoyl-L-alanine amidase [Geobacter sp. SVR]GCF85572.1 N-acetylmuramoyl-L-alanine amidase [Geobacter sp. SVR]
MLTKPKGIIIHHSLTKDGTVSDFEGIKRYHMEEKGWDDIGYHFLIENMNGTINICTGRPINKTGAHTVGHNDCIGVCVVGNFDLAPPDEAHMNTLVQLTLALLGQFPYLTPDDIHRHSEYAPKSCPGKLFPWDKFISTIRNGGR